MTLAKAFRVHGLDLNRWMDRGGRIHHGKPPAATPAMPIATHTFHGGPDPADQDMSGRWWLVPGAMNVERDAMREWCPTFTELPGDDAHPPAWFGSISTPITTFKVLIVHRHDHGLPLVLLDPSARPLRAGAPHRYVSGRLCVADESDWRASEHTAATVVGWAAHWFDAYVDWLFFKTWPLETHVSTAA